MPALPSGGSVLNTAADRVVCYYEAFGRPSAAFPFNSGRTCTHEVGHYPGRVHVGEDGGGYFDAQEDTPTCANTIECETALGDNMMFPYSIGDMDGCVHATGLTSDQAGVMNRYTGVQ